MLRCGDAITVQLTGRLRLLAPLILWAATSTSSGQELGLEGRSTLSSTIAPHNVGLDAAIASQTPTDLAVEAPEWVASTLEFHRPQLKGNPAQEVRSSTAGAAEAGPSAIKWRKPQRIASAPALPRLGPAQPTRATPPPFRAETSPAAEDDGSQPGEAMPLSLAPVTVSPDSSAEESARSTSDPLVTSAPSDAAAADESLGKGHAERLPVVVTPRPVEDLPPLSSGQRNLREKIRRVLKHYYGRPLDTASRSPWEVMHGLLAYEVHSQVLQGGPHGDPITAVGWLCFNQPCKRRNLLYLNHDGELRVRVGPALQGHHGQLLAMLAQARVKSDYPMRVDGKELTIADLIEMEKLTCYPRTELTFKLIGLQRYLDLEETWINDQGMTWDFPTMLQEEMRQPVRTAACGGTHRLSGLTLTVKKRQKLGMPVDGQYAKAAQFVANYQNFAYRLQNSDGSLSTEWFRGPGSESDIDRRLKTTGHLLEWLLYAASDKQLTYYRTVRATNYLADLMWNHRNRDWEAGPLGHAIHALVLYDRLVFAPYDQLPTEPLAGRSTGERR
jgi:hypothetical protein